MEPDLIRCSSDPGFEGREQFHTSLDLDSAAVSWFNTMFSGYREYFTHSACWPSLSLALLYLTVLSFGGQMVTFLLASGFNSFHIALVRSCSVVIEVTATWIAPWVMANIGAIRSGLWFLNWQILVLGATAAFFWTNPRNAIAASGLAAGTILSRVGLWGYDLSAQIIIQSVSLPCTASSDEQLLHVVTL